MTEAVINRVVRLVLATTAAELHTVLGYLPHGVRFGVARQLEELGEAHRYEITRHCAYYLRRHENGIAVWRWSYVASQLEANRLRTLVDSLDRPLDIELADRVFEQATHRSVENPRPRGMALLAADFGGYPALRTSGA